MFLLYTFPIALRRFYYEKPTHVAYNSSKNYLNNCVDKNILHKTLKNFRFVNLNCYLGWYEHENVGYKVRLKAPMITSVVG